MTNRYCFHGKSSFKWRETFHQSVTIFTSRRQLFVAREKKVFHLHDTKWNNRERNKYISIYRILPLNSSNKLIGFYIQNKIANVPFFTEAPIQYPKVAGCNCAIVNCYCACPHNSKRVFRNILYYIIAI